MPQHPNATLPVSRVLAASLALALGVGLAACAPEPAPAPSPSVTRTPPPQGDGVLTFGTLFPTTGATSFLAKAQDAGVELAVREINEAGGVGGKPVVVYHRDSGDASSTKAEESLADLAEKKVDVIIGPSSSVLAERILPKVIAAGMVMISPSATSPVLSTLHDDGRFFRTIPSSALEGAALAGIADGKKIALISFADADSEALRATLIATLKKQKQKLAADETFSGSAGSADAIVAAVAKSKADIIVLASPFSAMEKNKAILAKLASEKLAGARLWLTGENLADYSQALPAGTLKDVNGILEGVAPDEAFIKRLKSADPTVTDFRYAAEAYDATILAALAAVAAANDSGEAVAGELRAVSAEGIKCTSFAECVDVLKSMPDIDYDGVSGPLGLDKHGDPRPASFGLYRYDGENKFARVGERSAG